MSDLTSRILTYIDYLEDPVYWKTIGSTYSADEVDQALLALLSAESAGVVSLACLFIRDLVLIAPKFQDATCMPEPFNYSALTPTLEHLVKSSDL